MPFVPVPEVAEFSVVQDMYGENVINTYHIKKEGGWDSGSLADMSVVLISWYNDDLAPNLCTALQFIRVDGRDLSTSAGAVSQINFPPGSGGDSTAACLPGNAAVSVSHTTGFAGRSARGRTSVAGIAEGNVNGNLVNQDVIDSLVNAFDALDAAILAAGGTWGVVSKYSGYTQSPPKYKKVPTPRAEGIFRDIINNSATRRLGVQTTRMPGHGQ